MITPWLSETIHRLGARGVEVEVLAPSYRALGDQTVDGVRVHRFRYAPAPVEDLTHDETAPDRVRRRPAYLALVPGYVAAGSLAAARLARRGAFDLVHVHWPIPHGIMGLAAARAARVPLVSTFHGVELTWVSRQMPFLTPLLRSLIRRSDAVTANSSYTAAMIRAIHDRPVERIPFGATVPQPPTTSSRATGSGPLELLFAGRLVERKGVEHLLEAVARLPSDMPVHLTIVGDGPLRGQLEQAARARGLTNVDFAGFVDDARLSRAFQACDVFVLPAVVDRKGDVEGLGVVLIEALTYGKAVIASRAGGITDIVRDGETGLLVPPGEPAALSAAIERLARDPALRAGLGERGREHARAEFGWDGIIDRLERLYRELVA